MYIDPTGEKWWKTILGTLLINIIGIPTYILTGGNFGFVGYYDDDKGKAEIWAGAIWSNGTAQVQIVFDDRKISVYGSTVFNFDASFKRRNNVPQEYDPGATYIDPITGQEYFANSGSESFDNFLANRGFYSNPGEMNIIKSYDVYFGTNYLTSYSPYNDALFCVFENCEYIASIYGSDKDINYFIKYALPSTVMLGPNPEDYRSIIKLHFKTGKGSSNPLDIFKNVNSGYPTATFFGTSQNTGHAVTVIGYNTTTYQLIYMDPQIGINRKNYSEFRYFSLAIKRLRKL